jgi:4-hydroxy-2-oxoheptanedioate aldolase
MNNPIPLRVLLDQGKTTLGTWCLLTDPAVVEILAASGFDFVVIDMEHGPHGFETACNLIRSAELQGITALLRPPGVDESAILRALDCGAHGLLVPNVSSRGHVADIVRFAFYPPAGERGHSPFTRAGGFTHVDAGVRMKTANASLFLGILIEGPDGLAALPQILEEFASQLSVVYVGLYDLAKAVGCAGDVKHPKVIQTVREVAGMAAEHGVHAGMLCNDQEMIEIAHKAGVRFICYQNDTGILHESALRIRDQVRRTTGKGARQ